MTSKERVQAAFNFTEPDHTPLDYYATPEIQQALSQHFGVSGINEVRECLGTDIRFVNPPYTGPPLPTYSDGSSMNIWGIIKKPMSNEYGDYMESINWPYAEWATVEEAAQFPWPDPDLYDYESIPVQCAEFSDKAIFYGTVLYSGFYKRCGIRPGSRTSTG